MLNRYLVYDNEADALADEQQIVDNWQTDAFTRWAVPKKAKNQDIWYFEAPVDKTETGYSQEYLMQGVNRYIDNIDTIPVEWLDE